MERPLAYEWEGRRREVIEVLDRWYEGGRSPRDPVLHYFKVKTDDRSVRILRYNTLFDAWAVMIPNPAGRR